MAHLTYHEITSSESSYRYGISVQRFDEHVVAARTLCDSGRLVNGTNYLTFDDGSSSQYTLALPLLTKNNQKGIFFVTAGWTERREGYMSWEQLRELRSLGHEIQSHGWSHAFLTHCSAAELMDELTRSKGELEDHLGAAVTAISMPGGRWNEEVLKGCVRAGYTRVYTSNPWTRESNGRPILTGRWMVTHRTNAKRIRAMLTGTGLEAEWLRYRYILKEAFKLAIGDSAYQRVWKSLARKHKSIESSTEASHSASGMSG